jgi:hypothetical protein
LPSDYYKYNFDLLLQEQVCILFFFQQGQLTTQAESTSAMGNQPPKGRSQSEDQTPAKRNSLDGSELASKKERKKKSTKKKHSTTKTEDTIESKEESTETIAKTPTDGDEGKESSEKKKKRSNTTKHKTNKDGKSQKEKDKYSNLSKSERPSTGNDLHRSNSVDSISRATGKKMVPIVPTSPQTTSPSAPPPTPTDSQQRKMSKSISPPEKFQPLPSPLMGSRSPKEMNLAKKETKSEFETEGYTISLYT